MTAYARAAIPASRTPHVPPHLGDLLALLENRVTPAQPLVREGDLTAGPMDAGFSEILTAGWVYELGEGEAVEEGASHGAAFREYQNTCQLLFKAIELQEARAAVQLIDNPGRELPPPGVTGAGAAWLRAQASLK